MTKYTVGDTQNKYLVTDFKPFKQTGKYTKYDYVGSKREKPNCKSNPELNDYINKPQFSRDLYDYNVDREGYKPRKLVCEEKSSHEKRVQTKY